MTNELLMDFSDYARSVGTSRQYVHKLYKQGRLKKALIIDKETGQVMIDKEIADKLLFGLNNLDNTESFNPNQQIDDAVILASSTDEARRFKICFEAISEKNKVYKEHETLVLKKDVEKEAITAALIFRDRIQAIPNQVSQKIVGLTSKFAIKSILTEHINKVLERLSTQDVNNLYAEQNNNKDEEDVCLS